MEHATMKKNCTTMHGAQNINLICSHF